MKALLGDTLLAIAVGTVAIATTAAGFGAPGGTDLNALGVVLMAAIALALVARRRSPLVTLAVVTVLTVGYLFAGYPFGLVFVAFAIAVYTVARHRPLVYSVPASLAALAVLLSHLLFDSERLSGFLYGSAWMVVPFATGVAVRARREVAARDRAEAIRAHVDDERLRVAQEVHDIVGHGLAAIKMQADVALHVLAKRPEQAQPALEAISSTSSQALDELRVVLAEVRDDERSSGLGLGRLDALRRRMGEAGLEVVIETTGTPRGLPAVVDLTGYRIVQESLTNVLRHGNAGQATVAIRYADAQVEITVWNPVRGEVAAGGEAPSGNGSGIAGMRRRVDSLGGSFSAGPTASGRFEVRAVLPTASAGAGAPPIPAGGAGQRGGSGGHGLGAEAGS